jgi:methionine-rich copper-binding protein CopC
MIGPLSRIAIVLSLVLAFASLPSRTQAADTVTNATPADGATLDAVPSQVVLSFLESIDPETVQIVVIAPNGARADTGLPESSVDRSICGQG